MKRMYTDGLEPEELVPKLACSPPRFLLKWSTEHDAFQEKNNNNLKQTVALPSHEKNPTCWNTALCTSAHCTSILHSLLGDKSEFEGMAYQTVSSEDRICSLMISHGLWKHYLFILHFQRRLTSRLEKVLFIILTCISLKREIEIQINQSLAPPGGPKPSSTATTWELFGKAESQLLPPHPQVCWIRICFLTRSSVILTFLKIGEVRNEGTAVLWLTFWPSPPGRFQKKQQPLENKKGRKLLRLSSLMESAIKRLHGFRKFPSADMVTAMLKTSWESLYLFWPKSADESWFITRLQGKERKAFN